MSRYVVTLSCIEIVPIIANNELEARQLARKQLNPDQDWDIDGCDNVDDNPNYNFYFDENEPI